MIIKRKEIWQQARELVQHWEKLTRSIGEAVSQNEIEKLAALLDQRQQISEQLDALREVHKIPSWTEGSAPDDPPDLASIKEDVAAIFQSLLKEDQGIIQELQEKAASLKKDIHRLKHTKTANHAYHGHTTKPLAGSFIDTKK
jgi:L-serine deaminase